MKKENILTALEAALEKELGDFDFAIDWDTKKHQVEIIVTLFAQNKDNETFEDDEGVTSEEEYIEFEDSVLFYMSNKQPTDLEEYLATFSFDKKKGLSQEFIAAFASYLFEVLIAGQDDLLDFLTDESIETFELKWDTDLFEENIKKLSQKTFVPYPSY